MINSTSRLGLKQPTYLHDGEETVDALNENMTTLDGLYTYLISYRSINSDENAGTDSPISGLVLDRATGQPVLNRLALT